MTTKGMIPDIPVMGRQALAVGRGVPGAGCRASGADGDRIGGGRTDSDRTDRNRGTDLMVRAPVPAGTCSEASVRAPCSGPVSGPRGSAAERSHFFAVVLFFVVVLFLAGALRLAAGFFAGPFARFSASFSMAIFSVISSTVSDARSETFVVPSVM